MERNLEIVARLLSRAEGPVAELRGELEQLIVGQPEWAGAYYRLEEILYWFGVEDSGTAWALWERAGELAEELLELPAPERPAALGSRRFRLPRLAHRLILDGRAALRRDRSGARERFELAETLAQTLFPRWWAARAGSAELELVARAAANHSQALRLLGRRGLARDAMGRARRVIRYCEDPWVVGEVRLLEAWQLASVCDAPNARRAAGAAVVAWRGVDRHLEGTAWLTLACLMLREHRSPLAYLDLVERASDRLSPERDPLLMRWIPRIMAIGLTEMVRCGMVPLVAAHWAELERRGQLSFSPARFPGGIEAWFRHMVPSSQWHEVGISPPGSLAEAAAWG